MNTHEYQAKQFLKKYGIPIPEFAVISQISEVDKVIEQLALKEAVIKIQVHAGGRGKAGGVKFASSPSEIKPICEKLLGMRMCNEQTGPRGVIAHQVLLAAPVSIQKEFYLGAIIDREKGEPIIIASPEGGMDIEEIAEKHPERLLRLPISLEGKMKSYHLMHLAKFMGWQGDTAKQGMKIVASLAKAFMDLDGSLLEINPLVQDTEGKIWALDAKFSVDDNALYRQPEVAACYDPTQDSPSEVSAKAVDLAYIALDGNIGCMVNGAGLAMATMDIIQHYGGKPANFLDVGGGASKEKVAEGFKIILADSQVKAIFINIFGGIMNCGTLAEGIIAAAKDLQINIPLVVRMEGTNVQEGKRLLKESKLPIITADHLAEGAQKVIKAAQG